MTSLAIGEPNFPTPAHVCDAAKQAIDEGFTRYTAVPGIPPLREAIAGYFKRAYGVDVAPDCTIASNGGKQSLYNLFAALLNDGDEVLIPSPYWVSYPDMVYLNGGVPVAVKAPASQGFKVTVEQLEAALTPKTKILVFNSPSNPTGACYSVPERDAIVKWALDRGLFIIADEIYDPARLRAQQAVEHHRLVEAVPGPHRRRQRPCQELRHDRLARGLYP
mgnify:CR=1 FL=1